MAPGEPGSKKCLTGKTAFRQAWVTAMTNSEALGRVPSAISLRDLVGVLVGAEPGLDLAENGFK